MESTLNQKVVDVEKKVYVAPELIEYGILSEVTNSGGVLGEFDAEPFRSDPGA
jgi:hypothetical protein